MYRQFEYMVLSRRAYLLTRQILDINVGDYSPKVYLGALSRGEGSDLDGRHCVCV